MSKYDGHKLRNVKKVTLTEVPEGSTCEYMLYMTYCYPPRITSNDRFLLPNIM